MRPWSSKLGIFKNVHHVESGYGAGPKAIADEIFNWNVKAYIQSEVG